MGAKRKPPVGTITVNSDDGYAHQVDIQAPGAAIRFAVGGPNAHGKVWRLWSSTRTPDLYLAVRDRFNGGDSKFSFHASGDWRLQYEYSTAQALGLPRVLDRWERPAPGADGAIEVARVLTPSDDVVETGRPEPAPGKITWVRSGPPGALHVLRVLLVPAPENFTPPSDQSLVAAMAMAGGSVTLVLHGVVPVTSVDEDAFRRMRQIASENPPPGTPASHVPRSDPEYRCEGIARAQATDELIIVDLLM